MTIDELKTYLQQHGVPPHTYVIQELGNGEVDGIGFINGAWCTYYSERGRYGNLKAYPTEEEAVAAFLGTMRQLMATMYGKQLP